MEESETGLSSIITGIKTGIKRRLFSRSAPQPSPETKPAITVNPEEVENYIQAGLDFIKQGKYQEAMNHFQNRKAAKVMGIETGYTSFFPLNTLPAPDDADSLIHEMASHCHSQPLRITGFDTSNIPPEKLNNPAAQATLTLIQQNMSLLGAEEWIHNLQDAKHGPLIDARHKEVDVAAYLLKSGVTLTDQFLDRYQRREYLKNLTLQPPSVLIS